MTKQTKYGIQHQFYLGLFTLAIGTCTSVNAADMDSFEQSQRVPQTAAATEGAERVQAISPDPIALPKKPPYPPVKPGYYQGQIAINGHGGNMVTGETPLSQFNLATSSADYQLLQQTVAQNTLPSRNSISSHQLLNTFDYKFENIDEVSNNYAVATELAPSPYNQGTHLLLVNIALTQDASDKAVLGFNWLQATMKFNPRLVSEYRLVGFEKPHKTSVHDRQVTVSNARQYLALYELRLNEIDAHSQAENPSITQRFSATEHAELSISDARSTSGQRFINQIPIDINQLQKFFEQTTDDFRFAAAVAGLGQLINRSNYVHDFDYQKLIQIAKEATKGELNDKRAQFIELAESVAVIALSSEYQQSIKKPQPPHQREPYPMPQPIKSKRIGELLEGKQQLILPVEPISLPKPPPVSKHI
ncbi:von Willebrand factor type A domain-containing protein [Shewanella olleyana]|uniref:YfbK domain-containing protein n=1 Tax=Shewanella olleyana TaxID=135626 RepID=UPI00200E358A|nr:von Willebrand factor type A domain-containing protein [Shewanella olleyana]MCL1067610.1 von Willebrand factor type A domain-containing protein [Shewanella olleyana]